MSIATYADVIGLVGEIDDLFVERIVETGASPAEVAQALNKIEDERGFGDQARIEDSARVAAVRAILEEAFDEDEDAVPAEIAAAP